MIRILFDNQEINPLYITRLHQTVQPFNNQFKIGTTICRQFSFDVRNEGVPAIPDQILFYEDNGSDNRSNWSLSATLLVDDVDYSDDVFTSFSVTDMMVRFNIPLVYTAGESIEIILNRICEEKGISLIAEDLYMSDFVISWEDDISERDLISYIAEVNGAYAYIKENGDLVIERLSRMPVHIIEAEECSAFTIGSRHYIDRVYVELAAATQFFPETSDNDTLYLNPENILLTGGSGYETMDILQHIHSIVNGFCFYNIDIEKCPINPDVKAGQLIGLADWNYLLTSSGEYLTTSDDERLLISGDIYVSFICTIDYDYNVGWYGGYKLELENGKQQETHVVTAKELIRRLDIRVDREMGLISQSIANIEDGVVSQMSAVEQRADSLEVRVASNETNISEASDRLTAFETSVTVQCDGVRISQGTEGSYTKFTDSGMDIYVGGEKTAWAQADGFYAKELMVSAENSSSKWHISETADSLTFYKEES